MPDGEVGPRQHWISRVHYQVLADHPELEVVQHPAPDDNRVERHIREMPPMRGGSRFATESIAYASAIPAGGHRLPSNLGPPWQTDLLPPGR
jgi:hypothetical protein